MPACQTLHCAILGALFCALAAEAFAETPEQSFAREANLACRAVLDTRLTGSIEAGTRAGTEVLGLFLGQASIDDGNRAAVRQAIVARRDEFLRSRDWLEGLEPPVALASDWNAYLGWLEAEAAFSDSRLVWLDRRDGNLSPATDFLPAPDAVAAMLDRLAFTGRDCELIAQDVAVPDDWRAFVRAAAPVCTGIVDRRAAQGYAASADIALAALVDAMRGDLALPAPEAEAALSALAAEWEEGGAELGAIPAELVPDPVAWQGFLQRFDDAAALHRARLEVLRKGGDAVSEAYKGIPRPPVPDVGLDDLYLDRADCRSLVF